MFNNWDNLLEWLVVATEGAAKLSWDSMKCVEVVWDRRHFRLFENDDNYLQSKSVWYSFVTHFGVAYF
jgi:hypothetical protein